MKTRQEAVENLMTNLLKGIDPHELKLDPKSREGLDKLKQDGLAGNLHGYYLVGRIEKKGLEKDTSGFVFLSNDSTAQKNWSNERDRAVGEIDFQKKFIPMDKHHKIIQLVQASKNFTE